MSDAVEMAVRRALRNNESELRHARQEAAEANRKADGFRERYARLASRVDDLRAERADLLAALPGPPTQDQKDGEN